MSPEPKIKDNGNSKADSGEKGMGTAVIPGRDTSPVLQSAEYIFNKMSFLYSVLSKENALFLVLRGGMQTVIPLTFRNPPTNRNSL